MTNIFRTSTFQSRILRNLGLLLLAYFVATQFLSPAVAVAQPTIANPSFESPALAPGGLVFNPLGSGWAFSSGPVGITRDGGLYSPYSSAVDGVQSATFANDTSVTQVVNGFTAGQNYQLDWLQTRSISGSGGLAFRAVLDKGLATETVLSPYEVAGTPTWYSRSSDVFTAQKDSYTVTLEALDLPQPGYAHRYSNLDAVAIHSTAEAVRGRISSSTTLQVRPTTYTLQLFLGGAPLEPTLSGQFQGQLQTSFDFQDGRIRNLAIGASALTSLSDIDTLLDFGNLGTIHVTLQDGVFSPYTPVDGSLSQRLTVGPDGSFNLQNLFLAFGGQATYSGTGPVGGLVGDGAIDMLTISPADLGYTSNLAGDTIFPGPGTVTLTPAGEKHVYFMAVDIPVEIIAQLSQDLGIELKITSHIHAVGRVWIIPEPSTMVLALFGCAAAVGAGWRRRQRRLAVNES